MDVVEQMRGGLIVSCQARGDNPLKGAIYMAAMARAAVMGGRQPFEQKAPMISERSWVRLGFP